MARKPGGAGVVPTHHYSNCWAAGTFIVRTSFSGQPSPGVSSAATCGEAGESLRERTMDPEGAVAVAPRVAPKMEIPRGGPVLETATATSLPRRSREVILASRT